MCSTRHRLYVILRSQLVPIYLVSYKKVRFPSDFFFLLSHFLHKTSTIMSAVRSFQRSALKRAMGIRTYATEPVCGSILPVKSQFLLTNSRL